MIGRRLSESVEGWEEDPRTLLRLMEDRFSCRGYLAEQVPHSIIKRMLAIAQLSPSWCNSQPWKTIVTEGAGTERLRQALYDHALANIESHNGNAHMSADFPFPAAYRGIYKERQRTVGRQLYSSVGIAPGDRAASATQMLENFRLFNAPHMLLITTEQDLGVYGTIDCGIYLSSILLAAQSLGLGMIPQAALAGYSGFMRKYFSIPESRKVVVGASFGYPDHTHPANAFRSDRAQLVDVVDWVTT